jgi:hypothetical protein
VLICFNAGAMKVLYRLEDSAANAVLATGSEGSIIPPRNRLSDFR